MYFPIGHANSFTLFPPKQQEELPSVECLPSDVTKNHIDTTQISRSSVWNSQADSKYSVASSDNTKQVDIGDREVDLLFSREEDIDRGEFQLSGNLAYSGLLSTSKNLEDRVISRLSSPGKMYRSPCGNFIAWIYSSSLSFHKSRRGMNSVGLYQANPFCLVERIDIPDDIYHLQSLSDFKNFSETSIDDIFANLNLGEEVGGDTHSDTGVFFGEFEDLIWISRGSSDRFAINTSNGYLLLYHLSFPMTNRADSNILDVSFDPSCGTTVQEMRIGTGPGESKGVQKVEMKLANILYFKEGIQSMCTVGTSILVASKYKRDLQLVSWLGHKQNVLLSPQNTPSSSVSDVTQSVSSPNLNGANHADSALGFEELEDAMLSRDTQISQLTCFESNDTKGFLIVSILNDDSIFIGEYASPSSKPSDTQNSLVKSEGNFDINQSEEILYIDRKFNELENRHAIHFDCKISDNDRRNHGVDFNALKPVCTSYNQQFSLLAIGTMEGLVLVYKIFHDTVNTRKIGVKFSHVLQYNEETLIPGSKITTKAISSLAWTSDGYALAVGYEQGGFSVWSAYGMLLVDVDGGAEARVPSYEGDSYLYGLKQLFWTTGNLSLLIVPKSVKKVAKSPEVYSFNFGKYAVASCNSESNTEAPFLCSSDLVMRYVGLNLDELDVVKRPPLSSWDSIPFSTVYMSEQWPIRWGLRRADGNCIAFAGRRGFSLLNLPQTKWRVFGNQNHEESFRCVGGIAWFEDILFIACQDTSKFNYEIRAYPTRKNLDNQNILLSLPTESRTSFINIWKEYLIICSAKSSLTIYKISKSVDEKQSISAIELVLLKTYDLTPIIGSVKGLQHITFFPRSPEDVNEIHTCPLMFLNDGRLSIVSLGNDDEPSSELLLAKHVEIAFPYVPDTPTADSIFNAIWAFDGKNVKIWVNLLLGGSNDFGWVYERSRGPVVYPVDFYPLNVSFSKGIIMGVETTSICQDPEDGIFFQSKPKTGLIIHNFIGDLIQRNLRQNALLLGKFYERHHYFSHSMEMLLQITLESEFSKPYEHGYRPQLPLIIKYLKNFSSFYQILVRCARKVEFEMWEYLFAVAGDPKQHFYHCMNTGDLRTASSYLIIINTLEPKSVDSSLQVDLLENVLDSGDEALCSELVRYLTSISSAQISHVLERLRLRSKSN